jgi:class 3 adenylate cyclase
MGEFAVTEAERHPTSRTLVASFLFTDLVGYSKGTAAEQYAAKATLSAILRSNLATLRDVDYRIKDTGDGALIAFTSSPEHALYMALAIAEDFGRAAGEGGFPSNRLRTGIHLGSVKESTDLEARPNFVGDGINVAKRIMDFAAPGQITASRAFFDAVACLDSAYAELFSQLGAPDDKHGRAHETYAISASTTVLEKLKLELGAATRESTEFAANGHATIRAKRELQTSGAPGSQTGSRRTFEVVRKAALVVIAVIALAIASLFVGTKLMEPSGSKSPQATSETGALPAASKQVVTPPTTTEGIAADSQTLPASAPEAYPASPVRAARGAEGAPTPDLKQPVTAPVAATSTASTKIKSRPDPSPTAPVPADATSDHRDPRCSHIMEKATLGEALSTDEKRELASSCR